MRKWAFVVCLVLLTIGSMALSSEDSNDINHYEQGHIYFNGIGVSNDFRKAADCFLKVAKDSNAKAQFYLSWTYGLIAAEEERNLIIAHAVGKDVSDDKRKEIKKFNDKKVIWADMAYKNLEPLANSGDAEAQYMLARLYMGFGGVKDDKKSKTYAQSAYENLKEVAISGEVKAQRLLGELYSYNLIEPSSVYDKLKWYKMAACNNDVISQYKLGLTFYINKNVQDWNTAIHWWKEAADGGHIESAFLLGNIFDENSYMYSDPNNKRGECLTDDLKAMKWYKKAAELGHIRAKQFLSELYYNLARACLYNHTPKDINGAINWYTLAAEQGHYDSQKKLGLIFYMGDDIEKDYTKAFYWLDKAITHNDRNNTFELSILAKMYFEGIGVSQSYDEALELYKKAAEAGDRMSQYQLAKLYYDGAIVQRNYKLSAKWYEKAAQDGYGLAQFCLAKMYYEGKGVVQDYVEAYKWAVLASASNESFSGLRENIKKNMTKEQIAEGQKKASELYGVR